MSIIFSFWNEEEVIPELVARIRRALDGEVSGGRLVNYEMIFVNDASTDNSEELLRKLNEGHNDIRVLTTSRKFGISPCVLAGMERARGDVVVYMDADLQDPPEVIPDMLRAWREDPDVDVVHTVRLSRDGEARHKLIITRIGYMILRAISSVELPIEAGDFKLLSRRAVNSVVKLHEKRPYMRGLVAWIGFKTATVKYNREARFAGTAKFTVFSRNVISTFFNSAVISFSDLPLKAMIILGALGWIASLLYIVGILAFQIFGIGFAGWSATMLAIMFIGSANMLGIGVLGLYVNAIFLEAKGRPNYIVKHEFNFDDSPKNEKT